MITQIGKRWGCILAGVVGISGVIASGGTDTVAQITPDTTLGTENSVVTPNVDIQGLPADLIEGGATRDAALFHSFSEFNVGEGLRVYFANPVGIETIFSRVTGSDVSDILGTLGVNGGASLFLLNPNGIIFGENARLDIAGSFVGSTANAIGFGDQGIFSATEPETPPLLTINPDALFFNQLVTQGTHSIEVRGSLSVPSGESLLLVGGNVAPDRTATGEVLIDGGTLEALGGRVELAGVGEPTKVELVTDSGSFGLNFPAELARTDVSIVDSTISVRDADAGDIAIYARNLSMENSQILAGIGSGLGSLDAQAGNITINVTETMEVFGGDIQNGVRSQAIGKAGDIRITASSLSLRDGAGISTSTFGEGDASQVVIQARDSILFDGEDSQGLDSGVFSQVGEEAQGNSGRIEIETGSLTLTNGGVVSASIFGEGDGGQVVIQAMDSILFDGEDSQGFGSGVYSQVGKEAQGNSGTIEIEAGSLTFTNGGVINTSTFGEGDTSQVVIQATDSIFFDGENSRGAGSGVYSQVLEEAKGDSL
ncbi:MAG: filamentous hemagglutinin N-terminal domain-containing protein, partial [Coleofasciculus sp. C2-GNP5-27]